MGKKDQVGDIVAKLSVHVFFFICYLHDSMIATDKTIKQINFMESFWSLFLLLK